MLKTGLDTIDRKIMVDVKINHTQIFGDYYLFMRMVFKNNAKNADVIDFGICKKQELESLLNNPHLPVKEILENKLLMLLKSSFKEDLRTNYHDTRNNLKDYMPDLSIGFMMEFAKTELKEKYFLAEYNSNKDEFVDVKTGFVLARSYTVDYINGGLHDSAYDLKESSKILQDKKDIVLFGSADKDFIQEIPYYNQFVAEKFIEFTWQPSQEDFNELKNRGFSSTQDIYDYIVNELCKLPKIKKGKDD